VSIAPQEGGYEWQAAEQVSAWKEHRKTIATERKAAFNGIIMELPQDTRAPLKVIDVGAGDGAVTEMVLDAYPHAEAVLVDFSAAMMANGAEALQRFGDRYRYVTWDMNEGDWPAELVGPFDAVVSSAAIHHLQNERKHWLAAGVLTRLADGGVFVNYDLFRTPEAVYPEDEVHDKALATIEEGLHFLVDAGYGEVSVKARAPRPKHQAESALMIGRKSAPSGPGK
jgi:ubiquinone/menaquinone biosynthesis C-methylase UbiE